MIEFKTGVRLTDLASQMELAIIIAEQCYDIYKLPCVVTSCNDGQHREGSQGTVPGSGRHDACSLFMCVNLGHGTSSLWSSHGRKHKTLWTAMVRSV